MTAHVHAGAAGPTASTMADLDAQLLWQVTARSEELLHELQTGRPVSPTLRALLGYLREVVLTRIADQERRALSAPTPDGREVLTMIRADHLQLREDVEELAQALGDGTKPNLQELDAITHRLVQRLEHHLLEEAVAFNGTPAAEGRVDAWADAVQWYPMVEGDSIDMDDAACPEAQEVVLNRLLRLQNDEKVELHGHGEIQALRRKLLSHCCGRYTWTKVDDSPIDGWSVQVERAGS
jgi:hypothetical protein